MARRRVLVVYSKSDELWKDHVVDGLDLEQVRFEPWSDDGEPDSSSRTQILATVDSVLLLLTPSFLSSVPIRKHFLPSLLGAERRPQIFWLRLEDCPLQDLGDLDDQRLFPADGEPLELAEDDAWARFFATLRAQLEEGDEAPGEETRQVSSTDRQALYRKLFDRYYRGVFYFFARRGFDTEDCRDLSQETFLNVYQGLDSYRNEAAFATWIRAIMRNLWLNRLREAGADKRQASEVSLEQLVDKVELPDRRSLLGGGRPDPEKELLDTEIRNRLRAAVRELPPQARRCQLLQLEGLKYREIAAVLGISIQAVRSHLFQARQRLEQILKEKPEATRKKR